jgi:tRNA(Ile)-lysidine synthase TilS/MesJ
MQCSTCRQEAILFQPYSGRHLCRDHFILDLETKAKRAIRMHRGLQPKDHIAVAQTGDSADNALLFFLRKLTGKRNDIRVTPVVVDKRMDYCESIEDPGVTKIAIATTLEDAAASVLTSILRGNVETCIGGSPAGHKLPLITPFSHIPAEEIAAYARLCGVERGVRPWGEECDPLFADVKGMLADYSSRHPAAPHAVVNLGESLAESGCRDVGRSACNGS